MEPRRSRFACVAALTVGLAAALSLATGCDREGEDVVSEPTHSSDRRLTDSADALSASQRQSISDYLEFVAAERKVDYRVVVLDDEAEDLVAEGTALFERMQIGVRTEGRGLLLLVNLRTKEARVEVGYALEHRVRDVEASSMITQFLAPYFASGQIAAGIEASVERLVDLLDPSSEEPTTAPTLVGSGGAGANAALLEGIDRLTPETKAKLGTILVPQASPEDCVELEMTLMRRGIYYRDVPMYDDAWRRAQRPDLPAERLRAIAREWGGPFYVERNGAHAITYFTGDKGMRWGPQFLRRTDAGWIIDASSVAEYIVYDYSNRGWYALDGDYPYLALLRSVYDMKLVSLRNRGSAWTIGPTESP